MSESDEAPSPAGSARVVSLAVSLAASLGAGLLGAMATSASVETWYPTLVKPSWTPPDALFGPGWTTLYLLMGVAAWLVWRRSGGARVRGPLTLHALQLALNALWSFLFFGLRSPGSALIEILALWLAVASTLWAFTRVDRTAGLLLAPYLIWVTFAVALNLAIWTMNP